MANNTFYNRLQSRADSLIKKYGQPQTVVREKQGAYDPKVGQKALIETTFVIPMVTFPFEERFINGTSIKQDDLWGYFSAKGIPGVPQQGDKLRHANGKTYTFLSVKPLNPGGVILEYECHLTQG